MVSGNSCGPSPYRPIFAIGLYLFSADHWLRKLRTIALPSYFRILNVDYGIQLSITRVSKLPYDLNFLFIGCDFTRWG